MLVLQNKYSPRWLLLESAYKKNQRVAPGQIELGCRPDDGCCHTVLKFYPQGHSADSWDLSGFVGAQTNEKFRRLVLGP